MSKNIQQRPPRRTLPARFFLWWLAACLAAGSPVRGSEPGLARQAVSLLKSRCAACHGDRPDEIRGELGVLSRAALLAGGESWGAAIVPGKPEDSPLYQAVTWEDSSLQMPPKENDRFTQSEVETIRLWIAAGAPWPEGRAGPTEKVSSGRVPSWRKDESDGIAMATSGGQTQDWTRRLYEPEDVWAFMPVRRPQVPWKALGSQAPRHPIDAFVAQRLQEKTLQPAPPADPVALLRRATLDLTGLHPTPEEIDEDATFEESIDRLLASPHYGEQMARHWLDVARYADTSGFANDFERPNAWRYRDYVIRSFNDEKPYAFSVYDGPDRKLNSNTAVNLLPPAQKRKGTIQNVRILVGGALEAAGDTVTPGVLSAVYRSNDTEEPTAWNTIPETAQGRRLALARWIASDQNTLTARVIVNRVWQWHFGRGIVATPNSFGVNAKAMNVWFAGGGVKAGHAVGATDELGQEAVEVVRPIKDLHVTILRLLGLDDNRLTFFHEGRYKQLSQTGGQEIRELLA